MNKRVVMNSCNVLHLHLIYIQDARLSRCLVLAKERTPSYPWVPPLARSIATQGGTPRTGLATYDESVELALSRGGRWWHHISPYNSLG